MWHSQASESWYLQRFGFGRIAQNFLKGALRAGVRASGRATGHWALRAKKSADFCTDSTFLGFLRKSSSKLPGNWHHPFCSKRLSVPFHEVRCHEENACQKSWPCPMGMAHAARHGGAWFHGATTVNTRVGQELTFKFQRPSPARWHRRNDGRCST